MSIYPSTVIFLDIDGVVLPSHVGGLKSLYEFLVSPDQIGLPSELSIIGTANYDQDQYTITVNPDVQTIIDIEEFNEYLISGFLSGKNHGLSGSILIDGENDVFVIFDHVVDMLMTLSDHPGSVIWSSSWAESSNEINQALGIDNFGVLLTGMKKSKPNSLKKFLGKHKEITNAVLAEDQPYLHKVAPYVDTELSLIQTSYHDGLDPDQCQSILSRIM